MGDQVGSRGVVSRRRGVEKIVVVLSGGVESATLLYDLHHRGHPLKCLSFDYGQRHRREIESARKLAESVECAHVAVDLTSLVPLLANNSLSGRNCELPEGHYAEESMKQTVVPNRNMIMLSIAIGWAIDLEFDAVAYGAHGGDHAIYPDCRPAFADAMSTVAGLCDWRSIALRRPFIDLDKGQIVRRGYELGVPFELTWTCYNGRQRHCGKCGACHERKEAFATQGLCDPVPYEEEAVEG